MWLLIIISSVTGEKVLEELPFKSEVACEKRLNQFKELDTAKDKRACVRMLEKNTSPPVGSRAGE
jgi:hypothetical protein